MRPACIATRSPPPRPAACPRRSCRTCPTRSRSSSRATRARTGRSRPRSCASATASTRAPSCVSSSAPVPSSAASFARVARGREWCDVEVLRRLRRASLAALRKEIEPADQRSLAAFLPSWQGVDRHSGAGAGIDRLREVLVPLQGLALPAEIWERDVLPRRTGAYSQSWLDSLCASGELVWVGAGALGRSGRVALYFREDAPLIGPPAGARRRSPRTEALPRAPTIAAGLRRARAPARAPGSRPVLLLRPARRARPHRRGPARGAVGPRLGGRGDERRVGASARAAPDARPRRAPRAERPSVASAIGAPAPSPRSRAAGR